MSALDGEILALCRDVSDRIILPRYRNRASEEIQDKGGNDPVTIADRESEAALREALQRMEPGVAVVGEEAASVDDEVLEGLSADCWIVDPLDGTRNFATGKPPFGILLARASGGATLSGFIYDCLSGRFCTAHLGKGAFVNGERIAAQATGATPPVAAISLIFMEQARRDAIKRHICPHYALTDIPYCAAEQYPRLALGINDVSIFERTLAWDHAAGVLWLNEAGGRAARVDGSPYRVDGNIYGGLIGAATPALFDDLAKRLSALD